MKTVLVVALATGLAMGPACALPIILGTYSTESIQVRCEFICTMSFAAAPVGKRVINKGLNCHITFANTQVFQARMIVGSQLIEAELSPILERGPLRYYSAHLSTPFMFGNSVPTFVVSGLHDSDATEASSGTMACTLTGEVVNR